MQLPLEITFRGMSPSTSLEDAIRQWTARLERVHEGIQRCSVVIEQPHLHQRQGNRFHVRVDLTVPGRELAVSRDPARGTEHENPYIAVADAFRAARRRLQNHARICREGARRPAA